MELNGPHQSCTTCDDKSLPFFLFFFFLRKKIVSDGEKRVRRFLSTSKQYTSLFSITQEFWLSRSWKFIWPGVHLLFTYSRILWLLDPLHLFYMCTSAFCFFIPCNLMLYSLDSCFLIMVSKISLTVMVLFVLSPSLCWDFSYFEVHHADCKWIISLIHQLVHWKSCMKNNILCLIFWCCCSGLHIRQNQTFWRRQACSKIYLFHCNLFFSTLYVYIVSNSNICCVNMQIFHCVYLVT